MAIKSAKYSFNGINQDISRSKHDPSLYFEGQHIRIISEDSQTSGVVTNEKGTQEVFSIPTDIAIDTVNKVITYNGTSLPYNNDEINDLDVSNNHVILGHTTTKNSIILITNSKSLDCIWEVEDVYNDNNSFNIKLLYMRDLNLSINNPIQLIYNYENPKNEKIYWVDGNNQLRFLNLRHSVENEDNEELIDLDSDLINVVGNIQLTQPVVIGFSEGGVHESGMIQYAYNLYKTNLSQTTLSPLTSLIPLGENGLTGGGNLNEVVGTIPIVQINNIDTSYTNIKVYAIKYTSLNEIPTISIINDSAIPTNGNYTIYDDGNFISQISIDEFSFLGSNPIIPKHIETKDNHLFQFNIKEDFYKLKDFDSRAYSFNSSQIAAIADSQTGLNNGTPATPYLNVDSNYRVPKDYDAINPNYDIYKYQKDGSTIGGEGKYLKYELYTDSNYNENDQYLKSNEIYRFSIEFYNNQGQRTLPLWIADIKALDNNLNNLYNKFRIELKSEFYTYINSLSDNLKPTGYKILRAKRDLQDRTILCQGIINPMIANKLFKDKHNYNYMISNPNTLYDQQIVKYPSLIRTFENNLPMLRNINDMPLANINENGGSSSLQSSAQSEGFKAPSSSDWRGQLFQFNRMMQIYTPDVIFDNVLPDNTHKLKVKGVIEQSDQQAELSEINFNTQLIQHRGKVENALSPYNPNATSVDIEGNVDVPVKYGIHAPPGNNITSNLLQFYREFKGTYEKGLNIEYDIYGSPEVQVLGQGVKTYNNDSNFRYSNNYSTILQDSGQESDNLDNPIGRGLNTQSIKSITLVEGSNDPNFNNVNRRTIEQLYNENNLSITNGIMITELVKPKSFIYEGGIYGGNNVESKARTLYIPIGSYQDISNNDYIINSPGDTFVNDFTFTKMVKGDTTISRPGVNQFTEIVKFKVETTVDLKNRNDISIASWDNTFQPTYDKFQNYNNIYSQKEFILKRRNVDLNFKEVNDFGNNIRATKKKIAGEIIDSWTDNLVNETIDLDGKYGSINSTINSNDNIFCFQDKAVSVLSINPRVQTPTPDGIGLELGTGRVLQDKKYITTKSGSVNKWSVIEGARGIYYYDNLNKALFRINDSTDISLSDSKGLRIWFHNNHDYDTFKIDNPITGQGVLLGYDTYNKDVYISLQGNVNKTRVFNEKVDKFVDTKLYVPNRYIDSSYKFFGTNNNINVHQHNIGDYNVYYNENHSSFVTLMVNPASDLDCVFNNIIYKSELYLNDIDQPNETLTHIQAYNEFQDSGLVPLVIKDNIRRKFRDWKAFIPRDGRDRIRNPWIFLKLQLTNNNNYKLVLHDINILYSI